VAQTRPPLATATVPEAMARERLDRALAALCPELSRTRARKLVEGGSVFVDGQRVRVCSRGVHPGQVITCYELSAPSGAEPTLVGEPAELLVLDKPAGMPVEPTRSGAVGTLVEWAARRAPAYVTHRLDTPTSGLIILARTRPAQAEIHAMLQEHAIQRRYLAAVAPAPAWAEQQLIDMPLDDRPARTRATVVARSSAAALLAVELETGRTRQIRRHLAGLGFPVVGDVQSGGRRAGRLCLHAHRLDFAWRGVEVALKAPPPPDFLAELADLGLEYR
jgi:23S rRNA pseudouridine1911/1915/1917 synthase